MPWNERNRTDKRIKFVARLLDGESMSRLCQEFGISRKTGYKIFNRYKVLVWLDFRTRVEGRIDMPISYLSG